MFDQLLFLAYSAGFLADLPTVVQVDRRIGVDWYDDLDSEGDVSDAAWDLTATS